MAEVKEGLPITPAVVQRARERAGYLMEDASRVFKKIAAWEAGEALPTYAQIEQMAEKFKCPVAMLMFAVAAHQACAASKVGRRHAAASWAEEP